MKWKHFMIKLSLFLTVMVGLVACHSTVRPKVGRRAEALNDSAWISSVWISAADAKVVEGKITNDHWRAADGASWFVSTVKNEQSVTSAKWMTAALGVYDIYVNGHLVGEEFLKPGFTHYAKTKYSFTYDIIDLFKSGAEEENVLSAQVTPGWWGDKIITPNGHDGMIGKKCAFRGVLELTYADGTKRYYGTDQEHWKAGVVGPVRHAAIFDGEFCDARELPGYECVEKLSRPELNTEFTGQIYPSEGAEVYLHREKALTPVDAYLWSGVYGCSKDEYGATLGKQMFQPGEPMSVGPGETLVIDFGQNAAAVPSFVFKATEGTVLSCLPAEILNDGNGARNRGMDGPEGSCYRSNLRLDHEGIQLEYIFGKDPEYVTYMPRCTFFGYRYLSITATDRVQIQSIESIPVSSITSDLEIGKIRTGHDQVNQLISNTLWSMYSNYLSVPTDCPQRDERLGWTADAQVFAETGTFFANTASFMHKWMRDMRDAQSETGGFPGVAPVAQYGGEMMWLGWADAGIIVPWTIWKQFGDEAMIEENWSAMELFMDHVDETHYDHKALLRENGNYQWADWLSYEPLESCGGGAFVQNAKGQQEPRPEAVDYWNYLSASYWALDAGMMKDMAAASGKDMQKYEQMEQRAKEYIRTHFMTADGDFKTPILNTMQTPALFALKNEIVEGEAKERLIARLRENFKQHDYCLQTGFLGTSILMGTLTDNGMVDIAYELLFQHKNPSWFYSIDNGATTIWERWDSYSLDRGMAPNGMNSFNHYAYGCVCEWLWKTAAGISADPSAPGFAQIIMRPIPDRRLGHLEAEYNSVAGCVQSAWRYEGDKWIWNFTVPEEAVALVTLPGEKASKTYKGGSYTIELPALSVDVDVDVDKD